MNGASQAKLYRKEKNTTKKDSSIKHRINY